jgi:D-aminoacyl-tRNA deacylase
VANSMIALIQRVAEAAVVVNGECVGRVGRGILALIGVERRDSEHQADRLLERILAYRIFPDAAGRMNLDLRQIGGGLLLVPQFTLAANTRKGNRPSFTAAAEPDEGERLFAYLAERAAAQPTGVATGHFGAEMQVSLVNDGPVTFWLQVAPPELQVPPPGLQVAPPGHQPPPAA